MVETGTVLSAYEHVSLRDQSKKSHKAQRQSLLTEFPPELLDWIITYVR